MQNYYMLGCDETDNLCNQWQDDQGRHPGAGLGVGALV
jgi:hypothetical protein